MKYKLLNNSLLNTGALAALNSSSAILRSIAVWSMLLLSLTIYGFERLFIAFSPMRLKRST